MTCLDVAVVVVGHVGQWWPVLGQRVVAGVGVVVVVAVGDVWKKAKMTVISFQYLSLALMYYHIILCAS